MIRLRPWWRYLTSLSLALLLLIILSVVVALGSLFPSMPPDAATDPIRRAAWLEAAHDKYGLRASIYDGLSLFEMFRSLWFWVLFSCIGAVTLACAISRLATLRSLARFERSAWSGVGSLATHLGGALLIVGAGWSTRYASEMKGIILPPDTPVEIGGDWPYTLLSEPVKVEDNLPPSGDPSVRLSVLDSDHILAAHELRINHPLFFDGRGFYLKSYGPALSLTGSGPNGDRLALQLSTERNANGDPVTFVLQPGETADVILPDLDAALHLATSSRTEPSQPGSYFVRATTLSGETMAAGVIQPDMDFEIAGATLRLHEGLYLQIDVVTDPGFWPVVAGGALILLGAILALVPKRPKAPIDERGERGQG